MCLVSCSRAVAQVKGVPIGRDRVVDTYRYIERVLNIYGYIERELYILLGTWLCPSQFPSLFLCSFLLPHLRLRLCLPLCLLLLLALFQFGFHFYLFLSLSLLVDSPCCHAMCDQKLIFTVDHNLNVSSCFPTD